MNDQLFFSNGQDERVTWSRTYPLRSIVQIVIGSSLAYRTQKSEIAKLVGYQNANRTYAMQKSLNRLAGYQYPGNELIENRGL